MEFLFTFFYQPTANVLFFFLDLFNTHSLVFGILSLTVFFKILLIHSSVKTTRTQVKLNTIADDLKKIREDIKDKKEQAEKTIELYKKIGINPLTPLASILIQAPVLMSIFFVVQDIGKNTFQFQETIYSFINNPGTVDLQFLFLNLGEKGGIYIAIIAIITQIILMIQSQKGNTTEAAKKLQKLLIIFLPILIGTFSFFIIGAVGIFWIANNLFSILQEICILQKIRMEGSETQHP